MKLNTKNRRNSASFILSPAQNECSWPSRGERVFLAEVRTSKILIALVLAIVVAHALISWRPATGFFSSKGRGAIVSPEEARFFWLSGEAYDEGLYDLTAGLPGMNMQSDLGGIPGLSTLLFSNGKEFGLHAIHPLAALIFFKPLPLNRVDVQALTALPKVGPVLAGRIVAMRQQLSGFTKLEQLLRVSGIGPVTYQRLCGLLSVDIEP